MPMLNLVTPASSHPTSDSGETFSGFASRVTSAPGSSPKLARNASKSSLRWLTGSKDGFRRR